jgi:hypothetical protein
MRQDPRGIRRSLVFRKNQQEGSHKGLASNP